MAQLTVNKLPWYGQVGLFAGLSLLALGAFYYFYVMGVEADFAAKEQQIATLRASILKAETTGRQLSDFQGQVKALESRLESLKPILPETRDYGDLVRRIEDLARQSNIRVIGMKPMPTVPKQMHVELPVGMQIEGTYHNLGFFFDRVSQFPRIIHIGDLSIKAKEPPTSSVTVAADFTVMTFVLLEPSATPAAPGAK